MCFLLKMMDTHTHHVLQLHEEDGSCREIHMWALGLLSLRGIGLCHVYSLPHPLSQC